MSIRTRKFIGVIACITVLIVYCLVAMVIGARLLIDQPMWIQLPGFILLGIAWLPMIMKIIRWTLRPAGQAA